MSEKYPKSTATHNESGCLPAHFHVLDDPRPIGVVIVALALILMLVQPLLPSWGIDPIWIELTGAFQRLMTSALFIFTGYMFGVGKADGRSSSKQKILMYLLFALGLVYLGMFIMQLIKLIA